MNLQGDRATEAEEKRKLLRETSGKLGKHTSGEEARKEPKQKKRTDLNSPQSKRPMFIEYFIACHGPSYLIFRKTLKQTFFLEQF